MGNGDPDGGLYARSAISIYWIVNIPNRQIEVYSDPIRADAAESHYGRRQDFDVSGAVPLVLEGRTVAMIPVSDLLP